ncbi:MAG: DNA polymerase III subunit beta [Sphingobium sp.]|uniref:DNA polymerase III subunit beta n=1 Tax=Sphingobium sp. TaxID=1912891 RepID=UPI0017A36889|nr:DNA polymerase III subunit beta [Sphingobium sp.]MBA4756270.1 DNA polymerase III subunit beta [Sphingobium sp.]
MPEVDALERPAATDTLRVDRDTLLAATRAVSQTVERRNTIPILSNVHLRAENSLLTVTATDLDHWSSRTIDYAGATIDTTVEAERLITALSTLRPGAIDISYVQGAVTIRQGRSTRKLMTLSATDFPPSKPAADATRFPMDAAPLHRILDVARVCVSSEQTRYYLCGVFVEVVEGNIVMASTDGHRVIQVTHPAPDGAAGAPDCIIGTKAVGLICNLLEDAPEGAQAELALSGSKFEIKVGRSIISGKLVDASYPAYRRVFRFEHASRMSIQAGEFDRAVRAAGSASDGMTRAVRLELTRDHCEASGTAQDGGRSIEPMDGEYVGDDLTTGINLTYAQSIVKMFGPIPKVELGFGKAPSDLILITSDDRPGVIAGVMPMRA